MEMELDVGVAKEIPGICRCCLSEGCFKALGLSYPYYNEVEDYEKMLMDSLNICITQHSDGPNGPSRLICEACIMRLRDSCNFKKQVLDSEKCFIEMLQRREFQTKVEAVQEDQIKSEPEPEMQHEDGDGIDEGDFDMSDDDAKPLTALKRRLSRGEKAAPALGVTVEALPARRARGRPRRTGKAAETERRTKTNAPKATQENRPTRRRQRNLETLLNNTTVIPFKWRGNYLCFYCGSTLQEYTELRKHTLAHGKCSYRDYAIKSIRSAEAEIKIDVSDLICEVCNESFADFEKVVMHLNLKHNAKFDSKVSLNLAKYRLADLACLECGEVMGSFRKLVGHMNKNHPVNTYVCEACSRTFSKRRDLMSHVRNFHKSGGYGCVECGVSFESSTKLRAHKESSHPHVCAVCFSAFASVDKKRQHMNEMHLKDGTSECEFCKTTWNTKQAYLQHLRRCKARKDVSVNVVAKTLSEVDVGPYKEVKSIRQNIACIINCSNAIPFKFYMSTFRCFFCPTNFTECDQLRIHTNLEHPLCDVKHSSMRMRARQDVDIKIDIANLTCKMCLQSVRDLDALIDHLVTKHEAEYDRTTNVKLLPFKLLKDKYPCLLCNESQEFKFFVNLLKHVNEAHSNNKVLCVYCGEAFRSKNNMRSHVQKHHAPPKIGCPECDLAFHTGNKLAAHIAKVHGKNVYKCSKCPERFSTPYLKRRHMIDEHDIGCKCPHCNKMFTGNAIMLSHIRRTHLKEKTVECPVCHLKMFDVHMMKIHMVRHDGERNFHCDLCGKKFMWKKNLRNHLSVHDKSV